MQNGKQSICNGNPSSSSWMKYLTPVLISVSLLCVSTQAIGQTQQDACLEKHVWKGKVGNTPVMINFGVLTKMWGLLYYRNNLTDLVLQPVERTRGQWWEIDPAGKKTGLLTLSCEGKALTGEWVAADGGKAYVVSADGISYETEGRTVKKDIDYDSSRLAAINPLFLNRNNINRREYGIYIAPGYVNIKGLRLSGTGRKIDKINQSLHEKFLDHLRSHLACEAFWRIEEQPEKVATAGSVAKYSEEWEPAMLVWNKAFVVIGYHGGGFCGGAHGYYDSGAFTFNIQTGGLEDVSKWLSKNSQKAIHPDDKLGRLLLRKYEQQNPDMKNGEMSFCLEDGVLEWPDGGADWITTWIWPTNKGLVFRPATVYAAGGCIRDTLVPYTELRPYLSDHGKAQIKAFIRP